MGRLSIYAGDYTTSQRLTCIAEIQLTFTLGIVNRSIIDHSRKLCGASRFELGLPHFMYDPLPMETEIHSFVS